jgi:hypothetical protein
VTVWTCNVLCKHHATGDMRPRLWANDDCELLTVLYGIGASLDDRQPDTSWENYLITYEQQLLAVDQFGAVVTDYLEPRAQRAEREGDWMMVAQIERSREHSRGATQPLLRDRLAYRAARA